MSITGLAIQRTTDPVSALQRYLVLLSQHDALQKHLEGISALPPAAEAGMARSSPLSASPPSPSSSCFFSPHARHHRRSSTAPCSPVFLAPIPELPASVPSPAPSSPPDASKRRSSYPVGLDWESRKEAVAEDEMKLLDVNQQIKLTLTELLNCESVRGDRKYRMWIQSRLMEAERELKGSRRYGRRTTDMQMAKFW